jgi:uncharacterized protein
VKIEVEKIKEEGIELEEDVAVADWDLDSFDIKFVDNIHLDCKFKRVGKEIMVEAMAVTHRNIVCSRCLREARHTLKQDFTLLYNVNELGNYLDINKEIREEILLNYPMKVLCCPDCKGLCSGCNANLNIEQCRCK